MNFAFGWPTASGIGLVLLTSAGAWGRAPVFDGYWDTYGTAAQITCGRHPVLLKASHMDLKASGACRYVRVAGAHNDIDIDLAPGGKIEITGEHNDVTWHLPAGSAARPVLADLGQSNSFHKGE